MIIKRFLPVCCFLLAMLTGKSQSVWYVSPGGSSNNTGTSISAPTTLENALTEVTAGGTIYMRGGTYNYSSTIIIARGNDGSAAAYKSIVAYNGETPVLSFSSESVSSSNRGIVLDASYWHLTGLVIEGAGDNGMLLSGNNNIIENCEFRYNRDTGLQLSRYNSSYDNISEWPSNNLILNCESHDNADPGDENADGFAPKLTCGTGNVFRGCISHNNIDDGWDMYTKTATGPIGPVTLEDCVSYGNGTLSDGTTSGSGDKNGFKLGGDGIAVNHIVRRCVAFNNGHHGFTDNNNLGDITMTNNSSYNNAQSNYNFRTGGNHTFTNNLSYNAGASDKTTGTDVSGSNVWWKNGVSTNANGLVVSSADFISLTPSVNKNSDGSPDLGNFLALASGSDLIDAGVTASGITYNGSAPDIGARESSGSGGGSTTYTLSVSANPSAGGTVSLSPSGGSYTAGTVVTLTATAAGGYTFSNWSGDAAGSSASTTVTMNSNLSVTANFTASGGGGGSTLRIEDDATPATGLCSYDGSLKAYSGADNGYAINLSNSSGEGITWRVNAPAAGTYTLTWRYINKGSQAATTCALSINGTVVNGSQSFPKTSGDNVFATTSTTVSLVSGGNDVRIETTQSTEFADIDWIEINGDSPTAGSCTSSREAVSPAGQPGTTIFTHAGLYPNPASGKVTIVFTLADPQKISMKVFNDLGQEVDDQPARQFAAGYQQFDYHGAAFKKPGQYLILLSGSHGDTRLFKLLVK